MWVMACYTAVITARASHWSDTWICIAYTPSWCLHNYNIPEVPKAQLTQEP